MRLTPFAPGQILLTFRFAVIPARRMISPTGETYAGAVVRSGGPGLGPVVTTLKLQSAIWYKHSRAKWTVELLGDIGRFARCYSRV